MRTRKIKINGELREFILVAGIPNLVKVYIMSGDDRPWLFIGNQKFRVQEELEKIVMNFVNLKFQPENQQEKMLADFKKLCEVYHETH